MILGRGVRRQRSLTALALFVSAAFACTNIPPTDAGDLGNPTALALVPSATQQGNQVLFIGNGDGNDVRAFLPATHLFVRAPNAISPRIISLEVTNSAGDVIAPSFRPTHIAGGTILGLGYAIVSGTANRVGILNAQTFLTTVSSADSADCAATPQVPDASCLGVQALDVATSATNAYALLAPDGAGVQHIAVFTPTVENGAPVLTLTPPLIALPPGAYSGFTVSADGTGAYVADRSTPRVLDVPLPAGAPAVPIATDGPVRTVVLSPAYGTHAQGEYIFAILTGGRVDVLDNATKAIATIGGTPQAPIGFPTAVQAISFVPCNGACSLRVNVNPISEPALGFAALADGTTSPLVPDGTDPAVWRTANVSPSGPFVTPNPPIFVGVGMVSLTVGALNQGVTPDETFQLNFEAALPGLSQRFGNFAGPVGGPYVVTDTGATFSSVAVNDVLCINPTSATGCVAGSPDAFTVTAVTPATMTAPASLTVMPEVMGTPAPASAAYSVFAMGAAPWVLTGSLSDFVPQRLSASGMPVNVPAVPFFYPNDSPLPDVAFTLTLSGSPTCIDPSRGCGGFSFTTTSGFIPFVVADPTLSAAGAGLAVALAATQDFLYIAIGGGSALTEANLPQLGLANSVTDYH